MKKINMNNLIFTIDQVEKNSTNFYNSFSVFSHNFIFDNFKD